jgi:hypothetical protein
MVAGHERYRTQTRDSEGQYALAVAYRRFQLWWSAPMGLGLREPSPGARRGQAAARVGWALRAALPRDTAGRRTRLALARK